MKKILLVVCMVVLAAAVCAAGVYDPVTVSTTPVGFTAEKIALVSAAGNEASSVCYVQGGNVAYTTDETITLTTDKGIPANVGTYIRIEKYSEIRKFRALRTGSTDALLRCEHYF